MLAASQKTECSLVNVFAQNPSNCCLSVTKMIAALRRDSHGLLIFSIGDVCPAPARPYGPHKCVQRFWESARELSITGVQANSSSYNRVCACNSRGSERRA